MQLPLLARCVSEAGKASENSEHPAAVRDVEVSSQTFVRAVAEDDVVVEGPVEADLVAGNTRRVSYSRLGI